MRRIAIWILVITYALSGVVPAQGLVLCVGPDGHVEIEVQAMPGDCSGCLDESGSASGPSLGCPCVDTRLGSSGLSQVELLRAKISIPSASPAPGVLASWPPVRLAPESRSLELAPEARSRAVTLVRSVVLLV